MPTEKRRREHGDTHGVGGFKWRCVHSDMENVVTVTEAAKASTLRLYFMYCRQFLWPVFTYLVAFAVEGTVPLSRYKTL